MAEKRKDCNCGKHKIAHHEEMNRLEKMEHLNECIEDVIARLKCIKELATKLSSD
ncbi:MAG: hypothetical protein ACFFB5_10810 [Promethearchaeota archaeon]